MFKSPDSHAAFVAARDLINSLVSGETKIPALTIESAKSSLAYNTASRESTINDAASASFSNLLYGLPPSWGRIALARTNDIDEHDIVRVIKQYVQPIFVAEESIGAIASGLAKMEDLATGFEKLGYEVERRTFGDVDDESGSETGSESGSESGSDK